MTIVANITSCLVCLTYGFDWCTYRNYTQNCRTTSIGVEDLLSVVQPGESCSKPICLDGSNWGIYGWTQIMVAFIIGMAFQATARCLYNSSFSCRCPESGVIAFCSLCFLYMCQLICRCCCGRNIDGASLLDTDNSRARGERDMLVDPLAATPPITNPPRGSVRPNPGTPARPPPPPPVGSLQFGPALDPNDGTQPPQQQSLAPGSQPAVLPVANPVVVSPAGTAAGSQPAVPTRPSLPSTSASANPIPTPSRIPLPVQPQVPATAPLSLAPPPRQTAVTSQKKTNRLYVTKQA